jgi:putrescine transport system permease protein
MSVSLNGGASSKAKRPLWQRIAIGLPYAWLLVLFVVPFIIIMKISFADPIIDQPPFTPLIDWSKAAGEKLYLTLDNYRYLFEDDLYWVSYLVSVKIAGVSTLLCLLLGYPMAYAIARAKPATRNLLLLMVILPFWISFLLRVYAWIGILNTYGVLNNVMLWLGLIDTPVQFLYTDFAVYLGIVYSYLPFMILPLYANLERLNLDLHDAAADLGARPWRVFTDVTLPLSMPGIIAGSLLVFIPAMGEFVIPSLLGGLDTLMIGRVLFDEFFVNRDWPVAAAVAVVLLLLLVIPIMVFQHFQMRETETI